MARPFGLSRLRGRVFCCPSSGGIVRIGLFLCFLLAGKSFGADEVFDLDEIIVTATKTPRLLKDVPGSVALITREQIEKQHADDLGDYLRGVAGLETIRYGSIEGSTGIHLRGLYSEQTLVLVDGRVLNSPSRGSADISSVPIENIERIEVVRGPISSLYGANALAGVVNIITKAPPEKFTNEISFSYGGWDTIATSLRSGGTFGNFGFLVTPYNRQSAGHRDNSAFNNIGLDTRFDFTAGGADVALSAGWEQIISGAPGAEPSADPALRTTSQTMFGNDDVSSLVNSAKKTKHHINVRLDFGAFKITNWFNDSDEDSHTELLSWGDHHSKDDNFKTKSYGADLQSNWELSDRALLVVGVSFKNDKFKVKTKDYNVVTTALDTGDWDAGRTTSAVYLQDELRFEPVTVNLGVRLDHPSDFDAQLSPKVGVVWNMPDLSRVRFSYGQSFRPPTLNHLYWPADDMGQGTPDLEPATGRVYEIGWERAFGEKLLITTSIFHHTVDDMIAWAPTGPIGGMGTNLWQPSNVKEVKTAGAELGARINFTENFSGSITCTYLDAKQNNMELRDWNTSLMEKEKRQAAYTPEWQAGVDLEWSRLFGRKGLRLKAGVKYVDETYQYYSKYAPWPATDVSTTTRKLDDYTAGNIELTQTLGSGEIFLVVDNLFNTEYARQFGDFNDQGYPIPGRNAIVGVKIKF